MIHDVLANIINWIPATYIKVDPLLLVLAREWKWDSFVLRSNFVSHSTSLLLTNMWISGHSSSIVSIIHVFFFVSNSRTDTIQNSPPFSSLCSSVFLVNHTSKFQCEAEVLLFTLVVTHLVQGSNHNHSHLLSVWTTLVSYTKIHVQ
jgi:hypothetical protein